MNNDIISFIKQNIKKYSIYKLISDLEVHYNKDIDDLNHIIFASRPLFSNPINQIEEIIEDNQKIFIYLNFLNIIGINGISSDQLMNLNENDPHFNNIIESLNDFIVRIFYKIYKNTQLSAKFNSVSHLMPLKKSGEDLKQELNSKLEKFILNSDKIFQNPIFDIKIAAGGRWVKIEQCDQLRIDSILDNKFLGAECWINDAINIKIIYNYADFIENINIADICNKYHSNIRIIYKYIGTRNKINLDNGKLDIASCL